jgi:hypothetical protein
MEITRKRVNRGVRSYLLKIGGYGIRHPDFDDKHPSLLKKGGVHLSLFNKLSNSTHFRFVKITTQASEKA